MRNILLFIPRTQGQQTVPFAIVFFMSCVPKIEFNMIEHVFALYASLTIGDVHANVCFISRDTEGHLLVNGLDVGYVTGGFTPNV